ncbi:MAG TPA: hypothetical protein VHV76_03620 [Mycobacteriales bacterium]|nr:hypothetical protein [Mycobacteriales bacterium]
MPAEDDRPRDASGGADQPSGPDADATWADKINGVAPDDISALSRDIAAYHRELRQARRSRRMRLLLQRRGAVPLLVLSAATLLAGVVAVMLMLMAPRAVEHAPSAAPLAHPSAADGSVGGLLPAVGLNGPNGVIESRSAALRPAVFALIPTDCGCAALLNALAGQAFSETLPLAIVVPAASDQAAADLMSSLTQGSPGIYYDASAALAASVASQGVTIVVVNRDGTIYDVERSVTDPSATSLDAKLQSMLLPSRSHH